MIDQPIVSILINNYNYEGFVSQAINSALAQTYSNVEVIVVDDGSIDNSREIIAGYGDRIITVFKENGGQASALNAGFAVCKGEIICLLDADDLFLPERVSEVVKLFQLDTNIDWVFTESPPIQTEDLSDNNLDLVYENIRENKPKVMPRKIDFRQDLMNGSLPNFTPSTSNLCFSRHLSEMIFPLPEIKGLSGMAIDDFYIKLVAVGLGIGYSTVKNLGVFRIHNSYYSGLEISKRKRMYAELYTTAGYWIKINFPEFSKISAKMISKGYAAYLHSNYLKGVSTDADCDKMIKDYLSKVTIPEKFKVCAMVVYYYLRLIFQAFV